MRRILLGAVIGIAMSAVSLGTASAKTVRECDAEYSANKAAIQGVQKKADFVTACRAGTETIPGAAAAPSPQATAPAPAPVAPAPQAQAPVAPQTAARPRPTAAAAASGAGEFTSDTAAKTHCPSDIVVWVNTHSHIYHFAGHRDYGNTKSGAYMCEADANVAGNRAPLNEKHP